MFMTKPARRIALALTLVVAAPNAIEARPKIGNPQTLETAYLRWSAGVVERGEEHLLILPIGFAEGLSSEFVRSRGVVTIDLRAGRITADLYDLPPGTDLDLWLLDNRRTEGAAVSIDGSDRALRVAPLQATRSGAVRLESALPDSADSDFEIDRVVVARRGEALGDGALLYASPSLFQRLFFHARPAGRWSRLVPAASGGDHGGDLRQALSAMIESGEDLFVNELFDGNGRTCASCHPPLNNFTIDPAFIATLPPDDPLFVHETNEDLAELENSVLMRDFGLILENVDGLEDPTNKFVMRGVPHTLALATSLFTGAEQAPLQNTGWSGDGAPESGALRDFAIGAIRQHATKRLDRVEGTDFRFPTETELDDLEAFQLSLGRPGELELTTMTLLDPDADLGRALFIRTDSNGGTEQASKCGLCHHRGGATAQPTGLNQNFNIGVENQPHPADETGEPRPRDGGFGTDLNPDTGGFGNGKFASMPVVEAADTGPFFHNNVSDSLEDGIFFYQSDAFQQSPTGQEILARDTGGVPLAIETFKLASFMSVINTLENIRAANVFQESAKLEPLLVEAAPILDLALADVEDAVQVIQTAGIHSDVLAELTTAGALLQIARTTANTAARNGLIDDALLALRSAQPLMVVPRHRITSHDDGEVVSGTEGLQARILDVDVVGTRFQIDGQTLCIDREGPYRCAWDTTQLGNGPHTVTATILDYRGDFWTTEITVQVTN